MSKSVMLFKAFLALVIGLFVIVLPKTFCGWFTPVELNPLGKLLAGVFGAMLIGLAVIEYFGSAAPVSHLRKNVFLGTAIGNTIAFVITLIAQIQGLFSGTGWILVILWFLTAASSIYVYLTEKVD